MDINIEYILSTYVCINPYVYTVVYVRGHLRKCCMYIDLNSVYVHIRPYTSVQMVCMCLCINTCKCISMSICIYHYYQGYNYK